MDGQRFDGMAKQLATGVSRRGVLGGLIAVGAGGLTVGTVGAQNRGKSACAATCREQFPDATNGFRRGCVRACVQANGRGNSTCPAACREQFPEAKKGVRRGCVRACVQAGEE